ncbi:MAG: TIGR00282 family metallophosphoesterase [Dictyoglomi bacterium]|jgi:hypothetical protein|nr:TIGR00282 family metallophosphoesterase [Dictyoglomota bacterium]HHV80869.1 TIGR00282 family metallophosphoesterase [bacterium]
MQDNTVRIMFGGDIVGKPGRNTLAKTIKELKKEFQIDLIIVNGENSAGGFGITKGVAEELFSLSVEVITSGNHIWDKKEGMELIIEEERILRPLNYPPEVPGRGYTILNLPNREKIGIVNLMGRVFTGVSLDCPFRKGMEVVEELHNDGVKSILIDFHAEATSEKIALWRYLDGMVSAVLGTHTHVQTADEEISLLGTAYISDVGMVGSADGIIGEDKDIIIERFLTSLPRRFKVAKGRTLFNGVLLEIDTSSGKAISIERIRKYYKED